MIINNGSKMADVLQAIAGTWAATEDEGWKCYELGHVKFWKKVCQKGQNVLPDKFMKERVSVIPYLKFQANDLSGGVLQLQQQYIELDTSAVVGILDLK